MHYNILVTGIGGNVGQGILRNIKSMNGPFNLIGTNTSLISAGNHLCDKVYKVPYAQAPEYKDALIRICRDEKIDLIIPSTDAETVELAKMMLELPVTAVSDQSACSVFYDKWETALVFEKLTLPFAESWRPNIDTPKAPLSETIVKPRVGRGSRGIVVCPDTLEGFGPEYVAQRRHVGKEITSSFYVTKTGKVLGPFTFERELQAGTTVLCKVEKRYDPVLAEIIKTLVKNVKIKGSCNIQAIVEDSGGIIPFEVNCRISGTNSIRSQFGFRDVEWTVQELLLNEEPHATAFGEGCAVRILMDVIYPDKDISDVLDGHTPHRIF
ncbi:ATP-grasp domain-containing protein [Bdellovibrio bacteriovorus]|uniref:Carbamoyl phosphate synthase-like protein n=1 Tax=Bdellovibrio bacteriovorus str. Tiberius TaxID=1069642 RepID=K7YNH2_BDEBC|nr:ATP-grasp domain-containing protein [Bdellovibrio bacteriovorus]AFY01361.1 carbamoyl phosphate synthase-like protein [Bdellovibrio bacteriovorus str. Tiberius]